MHGSAAFVLWLGLIFGIKHATEADHLVAIATIVSETRSVVRSALVGVFWGLGHTFSILLVGVLLILLRIEIPGRVATFFELAVALMIILLGSRTLYFALRKHNRAHTHPHSHGRWVHTHLHFHDSEHAHALPHLRRHNHGQQAKLTGWRAVFVGVVHGLAGSAALTLLILTQLTGGDSQLLGLAYLLVFGAGSVGGMLFMSAAMSVPLAVAPAHFQRINVPIRLIAGIGSVVFGVYYACRQLRPGGS
ncbi:MAG: hypothetical protein ABR607_16105 [Pyrinomonadaceae bacterium]